MEQRTQVVSKFYRLKMSKELRDLLRSLPFQIEEEVRGMDHVYLGRGTLRLSGGRHPAEASVRLRNGGLIASVSVPEAGIQVEGPFETPEDRSSFPEEVRRAVVAAMD